MRVIDVLAGVGWRGFCGTFMIRNEVIGLGTNARLTDIHSLFVDRNDALFGSLRATGP